MAESLKDAEGRLRFESSRKKWFSEFLIRFDQKLAAEFARVIQDEELERRLAAPAAWELDRGGFEQAA